MIFKTLTLCTLFGAFAAVGCERKTPAEKAADKVGDAVEEASDEVGDAARKID